MGLKLKKKPTAPKPEVIAGHKAHYIDYRKKRYHYITMGATICSFAVIGSFFVLGSFAGARKYSAIEVESATKSGNVSVKTDTSAAGGSAIRFDAPPTATPPPIDTSIKSVLSYGAIGDGATDDSNAIQSALNALKSGEVLQFPAGRTFRHTKVITVNVANVRITGPGTLYATNEAASSFWINANNVTVDNMVFKMGPTTKRWDAFEQMKVRIAGKTGTRMSNITIDGSAAAGLYIGSSTDFIISDVTVMNTRADGIHMTGGSSNGQVIRPIVKNPGDDGVAIVSYKADGVICHNITVTSPTLLGQQWGRAFSVVGGMDITETNVSSDSSNAASIYIAAESSFKTYGNARITFDGGTLTNANTNATVDHGAIMVYSDQPSDTPNTDITIKNMQIKQTRVSASRQISVVQYGSASQSRLTFANITITGGSSLYGGNAPASVSRRVNWVWNNVRIPDVQGW